MRHGFDRSGSESRGLRPAGRLLCVVVLAALAPALGRWSAVAAQQDSTRLLPRDTVRGDSLAGPGVRFRLRTDWAQLETPTAFVPFGRLSTTPRARSLSRGLAEVQAAAMRQAAAAREAAVWGQTISAAFAGAPNQQDVTVNADPTRAAVAAPSGIQTRGLPGAAQPSPPTAAGQPPNPLVPNPVIATPGAAGQPGDSTGARRSQSRAEQLVSDYANLGLQLSSRLETKVERNKNERCTSFEVLIPTSNCRGSFQPQFDFQFNVRTGGVVADRVHVNVDYDSEREFDASNNINVYYEGKSDEILQRFEIGNVSFQPPSSRFITGGIPAGNYGLQAVGQLGPMTFRTILAQQKGNVASAKVFTVGDQTVQTVDREIEDYQVERRRFFWIVDPAREFGTGAPARFPNIDVLDNTLMQALVSSMPAPRRPRQVRLYRYRPPTQNGSAAPDVFGPRAITRYSTNSNVIGPFQVLQQGVDYYIHPSNLWIVLVSPLSQNERLAVSYTVTVDGREASVDTIGGTFPATRDDARPTPDVINLLWDSEVFPGDSAFNREMRNVYRLGGEDIQRQTVELKIVVGSGSDQEKPNNPAFQTYLQMLGLAQPNNQSAFDVENRLWPRLGDANQATNAGGGSSKLIRDNFIIFPSLHPLGSDGLVRPPDPANDSLYRTPDEDLFTQRRPPTQYRLRARYSAIGGGDVGTLALGSVQLRQGSERLAINGVSLRRDVDYRINYEQGQVTFLRPDTLFPQPRQVTVQYEENPLFATAPTSIFGLASEFPFQNGQLNFVAISQSQKTTFNRPPLGQEPVSSLVAGVSGNFHWEAGALTRALDRLPFLETTALSTVNVDGEFATSRPQPNAAGVAYVESFEGEGGITLSLGEAAWRLGSQPSTRKGGVPIGNGPLFDFQLDAAATMAWQNLGIVIDSVTKDGVSSHAINFYPSQIDPAIKETGGSGFQSPEIVLWTTLYPRSIGGRFCNECNPSKFNWLTPSDYNGRVWRSISQSLSPNGVDLSRVEQLEFWALIDTDPAKRGRNPTYVFDFGDISENSVAFAPDTMYLTKRIDQDVGGPQTRTDTILKGRHLAGYGVPNSERDPDTKSFDVTTRDVGLPGDLVDSLIRVNLNQPQSVIDTIRKFEMCRAGNIGIQLIGDTKTNCTIGDRRLDEEDLDLDGFLNFTSENERLLRYVVDLSNPAFYNRTGKCFKSARDAAQGTVCWVQVRVPFTSFNAPNDTINGPLVRRVKAVRLTMISGDPRLVGDSLTVVPIARLKLVGSPWVKRSERPITGVAGRRPQASGYVIASIVGTLDQGDSTDVDALDYQSPPGVVDQADNKSTDYAQGTVQINERSLRLVAGEIPVYGRAEAFYRFPESEKNFMGYKQLRVWARGRNKGWGREGDLEFFVKLGRDEQNFYMYRTPVNEGHNQAAWLPEVRVNFERFYRLRALVQNNYLRGKDPIACADSLDRALIAQSEPPEQPGAKVYAACEGGYIVFSSNPGVTPPNLAGVQEMSVGILRVGDRGTGSGGPIAPSDSLEVWVDDVRLTGVVDDAGYAGQLGVSLNAADVGTFAVTMSRRDKNFRQLSEQPSYITDDQIGVGASLRLDKFLPAGLGFALPLTASFSSSGTDPFFLSRSDIRAEGVEGLRRPRNSAANYSLSLRRTRPLANPLVGGLVNGLSLTSSYSKANSQSEYSVGTARAFTSSLDWNLQARPRALKTPGWLEGALGHLPNWLRRTDVINGLRNASFRWTPAQLRFSSGFASNTDQRTAYTLPVALASDSGKRVDGLSRFLRNQGNVALRPFTGMTLNWDLSSFRDLRDYGRVLDADSSQDVGVVLRGARQKLLGMDIGLETQRQMNASFQFAPVVSSWLRPRFDLNTGFTMFRDPNSRALVPDGGGALQLPRRLSNSQGVGLGASVDLARAVAPFFGERNIVRRISRGIQPLDVSWRRDLRSSYDGVPFSPGAGFQFGLGSVSDFRQSNGELATSAGETHGWSASSSIALPFRATLTNRYSLNTNVVWARRLDGQQATQQESQNQGRTFPDVSLSWSYSPTAELVQKVLTNVSLQGSARVSKATTFVPTGDPTTGADAEAGLTTAVTTKSYPINGSVTWALGTGLTTTANYNTSDQVRLQSGGTSVTRQRDVGMSAGKAFQIPESWKLGADMVRAQFGFSRQLQKSFTFVSDQEKRLQDNGRWSINASAESDVSVNASFTLQLSKSLTFDNLYDRRFSQLVISATMHLQFFAGEIK